MSRFKLDALVNGGALFQKGILVEQVEYVETVGKTRSIGKASSENRQFAPMHSRKGEGKAADHKFSLYLVVFVSSQSYCC